MTILVRDKSWDYLNEEYPEAKDNQLYCIIGFPKCGQISLHKYFLQKYGKNSTYRDEIIWRYSAVEGWKGKFKNWEKMRPVIIVRDPIDRMWSDYHYFNYARSIDFKSYLFLHEANNGMGERNPIMCSNFKKWIEPWKPLNPIIYNLDSVKKQPDFPHENKTTTIKRIEVPEMSSHYRELAQKGLELEQSEPYCNDRTYSTKRKDDFFEKLRIILG